MEAHIATMSNSWNRLIRSLQCWIHWNPSCCSVGAAVASHVLSACGHGCVHACTNTCTQHRTSSWLFPQFIFRLWKDIAPAFFACLSLPRIYHCVDPINMSRYYPLFWLVLHHFLLFSASPTRLLKLIKCDAFKLEYVCFHASTVCVSVLAIQRH